VDSTGAVVPNAKIVITNLGTRQERTESSNGTGDYVFNAVDPGTYSVDVTSVGFKAFHVVSVAIAAGDRARINAALTPGETSEVVQVTSEAPALQTDSSVVASVVTGRAVQDLPLNGRNIVNLVQTTPGVNEGPSSGLLRGVIQTTDVGSLVFPQMDNPTS
jgi:hypothetical protein